VWDKGTLTETRDATDRPQRATGSHSLREDLKMKKRVGTSSFFSHLDFIHQFSVTRLLIAAFSLALCLSATVSLAQQRRAPRDKESGENVRLRQEWFYQQRADPHKHSLRGTQIKAFEQPYKGEQQAGRRTMKSGGNTLQNVHRTISYDHLPSALRPTRANPVLRSNFWSASRDTAFS